MYCTVKAKGAKKRKTGNPDFGKNLKKLREQKYPDQVEFSIAAECSVQYISKVENGWISPTLNYIRKFSKALKMEEWELLKYESEQDENKENSKKE